MEWCIFIYAVLFQMVKGNFEISKEEDHLKNISFKKRKNNYV